MLWHALQLQNRLAFTAIPDFYFRSFLTGSWNFIPTRRLNAVVLEQILGQRALPLPDPNALVFLGKAQGLHHFALGILEFRLEIDRRDVGAIGAEMIIMSHLQGLQIITAGPFTDWLSKIGARRIGLSQWRRPGTARGGNYDHQKSKKMKGNAAAAQKQQPARKFEVLQ